MITPLLQSRFGFFFLFGYKVSFFLVGSSLFLYHNILQDSSCSSFSLLPRRLALGSYSVSASLFLVLLELPTAGSNHHCCHHQSAAQLSTSSFNHVWSKLVPGWGYSHGHTFLADLKNEHIHIGHRRSPAESQIQSIPTLNMLFQYLIEHLMYLSNIIDLLLKTLKKMQPCFL